MFISLLVGLIYIRTCACQIICPYCNPNYVDIPGLEEAARGYDVPMGNPNPGGGDADPGLRNQIFAPMFRDEDGHYKVDDTFITGNSQVKCDGDFSSRVYDKLEDYRKGLMSSCTTGFGIEMGGVMGSRKEDGRLISSGVPPLFSRSWNEKKDVENLENFFVKEKGSVSVTEAVCLTHRVDIATGVKKVLLNGFIESVKSLEALNNSSKKLQEDEFVRFLSEYGTHYASTSKLGTRIIMEMRYTAEERNLSRKDEISSCADQIGAKVLGLQLEQDKKNCSNLELASNHMNSTRVERMKVSTYGSFLAHNLADWTKQVVSLVNQNKFSGRVIQRELKLITDLFTEQNFENITREDGRPLDMRSLIGWFKPLLVNEYCRIFNMSCHHRGCGINDHCKREEWCIYIQEAAVQGEATHLPPVTDTFICTSRNSSAILPNGHLFYGSTKKGEDTPHGYGLEYKGLLNTTIIYEGTWLNGRKEGTGSLYTPGYKTPFYSGGMRRDAMHGQGLLFYSSGNKMFTGTMENGLIRKGSLYSDDRLSKVLDTVDPTNWKEVAQRFGNTEIVKFLHRSKAL